MMPNASDVRYSICMLCYNDSKTLRQSIDSLLELSKLRTIEIIVTDNMSNDGSWEILQEYQTKGLITCLRRRCSRGMGRQIALTNSQGSYVLAHIDCDDIFSSEGIDYLLQIYHSKYEGSVMMTKKRGPEASNITIAPKDLLVKLGGWRDLNWGEDWDLWARAAAIDKYSFQPYPSSNPPHKMVTVRKERDKRSMSQFVSRYGKYRDAVRSGRPAFSVIEHASLTQRMIYYLAKLVVNLTRSKLTPIPNPDFEGMSASFSR